ncbi:hypothetical protein DL768_007344 [Monosporascus sp. mg162]|nr:hypothetical protein DL768_007344 [Monosporascus sp. mg162]
MQFGYAGKCTLPPRMKTDMTDYPAESGEESLSVSSLGNSQGVKPEKVLREPSPAAFTATTTARDEPRHDQAETSGSAQPEPQGVGDILVSVPAIAVLEPATGPAPPVSLEHESSELWEAAYEELRGENKSLIEHYEAVLKDQTGIPQSANLRDQLAMVADTQRKKAENKQWKFHWFGEKQTARDTAERILNLTIRSASLISIGMTYAPPYVSIPWSAVTALIPLMMNDIKEHKGSIDGLEIVAKSTFSYQMAERAFLGRKETKDLYKKSVMGLYKKILKYQALSIEYFGKSTLRRLGKNVLGSTEWADMPATISSLDDDTRRSLQFLGQETQIASLMTIQEFLERQEHKINILIQKAAADRDHVAQIIAWVTPISVQLDHLDVREKLGEDHFSSGYWYFQERKVENWRTWTEGSQCLWLRGSIGTGKSSLTSIFIEDLVRSPDGVVALFYCSRKADKDNEKLTSRNNYKNILRSLLAQVAVSIDGTTVHNGVVRHFKQDPRRNMAGGGLSGEDCVQLLDDIFSSGSTSHFTIVIDALDECIDYDTLLELLKKATGSKNNVRIAFTSRFQVKVEDSFPDAATVTITSQNEDDIQRFLDIEIPKRRLNLFLDEIKSKRIRLEEDIQPKLDSLEASETIGEDLLYAAYNDVYDTAVGGTSQARRKEIVTTALRWVLCAFRPLTLRELAYATSVRQHERVVSSVQEGLILEFCSNLLIEDTVGVVRFPHLSVRHYLEGRIPPDFDKELAHLQAALTCLYFANSPHFHEIGQSQNELVQQGNVTLTKSFYSYVSAYWSNHCRQARRTEEVDRLIESFPAMSKLRRTRTFSERNEHADENQGSIGISGAEEGAPKASKAESDDRTHTNETSILKSSAMAFEDFLGLINSSSDTSYEFIAQYIARGSDLGIRDSFGSTLLHEAIRLHQLETARALMDAGAPVDAKDYLGNTPMHIASMRRFGEGGRQLLLAGADRNSRNLRGETPLHVAVMFGAQEVAETLLSANADALARDHQENTALHYAAAVGHLYTLESLLLMGYNPNGRNQNGDTAVSLAIKLGSETLVDMLLNHDVVLTEEDRALAALSESSEIIRLVSQYNPVQLRSPELENSGDNDSRLYSVEFGDSVSPCRYCNVARWIIASRTGTSYPHHQSIQHLYTSAEKGCPLCAFFKQELEQQQHPENSYSEGKLIVTIDPSSTQGSRMDRKDKLVLYSGDTPLLTYELCIDQTEDPLSALDWLTGTTISEFPHEPLCLQTIRNWIGTCDSLDEECSGDSIPLLPTRVLDVGENSSANVRLISSRPGQTGKYLYLSFPWGGRIKFTNNSSSMGMLLKRVPLELLPAIAKDAISMTRLLGLRYLWIDALCIVQDSSEDWILESSKMDHYIQDASCVIVAAAGQSSNLGLFPARQQPLLRMDFVQYTPTAGEGSVEERKRAAVYLRRPLKTAAEALSEHALRRAWMVQEVILPRRLLIMGTDQLYWHCRTSLRSEGSTLVQKPFLKLLPRKETFPSISERNKGLTFFPWYNFVHIYSPARTTFSTDRLAAVRALARYFGGTSQFAYGLWAEDLQNGLLWYVDDVLCSEHMDKYVAPSWSWASIQGRC